MLSPESVRNPLVLIANYFFDSIPQDAFHVEGGQLYESLTIREADVPNSHVSHSSALRARAKFN